MQEIRELDQGCLQGQGGVTQLATKKQVADRLQVSTRTLERLPIRFQRVGKQRRYDWSDVEAYLAKRSSRKIA